MMNKAFPGEVREYYLLVMLLLPIQLWDQSTIAPLIKGYYHLLDSYEIKKSRFLKDSIPALSTTQLYEICIHYTIRHKERALLNVYYVYYSISYTGFKPV